MITWKEEFDAIVRSFEMSKDEKVHHNFTALYIALEQASKKYLASEEMWQGQDYDIPLEDGSVLKMQMYDNYSTLTATNPKGESREIISKDASVKKEYSALDFYTFGMSAVGIGHRFPANFDKMLMKELKPGRIISFDGIDKDHQFSMVCTKVEGRLPYVKSIHLGEFKDISAKSFMKEKEQPLSMTDSELQKLYNTVKTRTGNVIPRHEKIDCFAQEQINKLLSGLKPGKTQVLQFGNERLRVHRSLFGNKLSWYDKNGERITEEAAKVFIAWCHNAPVITEVSAVNKTIEGDVKAYGFYREYEEHLKSQNFRAAADVAKDFCERNGKDFAIDVSTYVNSQEQAIATTFCFKSASDGHCEVYKVTYKDNDFTKGAESIKAVPLSDFILFAEHKYENVVNMLLVATKEKYAKELETSPLDEKVKEKIVEEAATKQVIKAIQNKEIVNASSIGNISDDINDLIQSYIEHPENTTEPIIYDSTIGTNIESVEERDRLDD